uniref:CSLF3-cellulose synthase-like family F n=1 Tax=Arundo donax TaxID=35708 RepID=A0A0A9GIL2_ARUDO
MSHFSLRWRWSCHLLMIMRRTGARA